MSNRTHVHVLNTAQLSSTRNAVALDTRQSSIENLNRIVVQMIDIALAAKHAHWNVRGSHFLAYHKLFDQVFDTLIAETDAVGERTAALGGIARATVQAVAGETPLKPYPMLAVGEFEHIEQLATRLGSLGGEVKAAITAIAAAGDHVSADVLTDAAASIDVLLWKIESHKPPG